MTTINDKVNLFSKIIYDKVNEEKEEKLRVFNEEAEKRIQAQKEKLEELKKNLYRETIKKSNTKANEIVAREKLNKQREILAIKESLIKSTLEDIHKKLMDFVNSEDYKDYLLNTLQKSLKEVEEGKYYIIILPRDYERFKEHIEAIKNELKDMEIKLAEEDFLGGVILRDLEGRYKVDNSLGARLEESKELIGVKVMEMLA